MDLRIQIINKIIEQRIYISNEIKETIKWVQFKALKRSINSQECKIYLYFLS
jgi:hypothetical protein